MHDVCGVDIDTNDHTGRIDAGCITEDCSWRVERGVSAFVEQERVCDAPGVGPGPYDLSLRVIPPAKRKGSARKVNRGERAVISQVSVSHATTICVSTNDCAGRVNRAGSAGHCSGWVEACEGTFLGHYEAVVSATVARCATGRVGTVKPG